MRTRTPRTTELGVRAGHGTPMRRLIESGAVDGRALVQVGLRGYWPPPEVFDWMRAQGMRWHLMREIEDLGIDAVVDAAIAEVREHADLVYLSIDIDVLDPGMAPGTGTPEPGGLLTRELLRAVRRIASSRGPRGHGRDGGLAAIRSCRGDRDGGPPVRARDHQRHGGAEGGRRPATLARAVGAPEGPAIAAPVGTRGDDGRGGSHGSGHGRAPRPDRRRPSGRDPGRLAPHPRRARDGLRGASRRVHRRGRRSRPTATSWSGAWVGCRPRSAAP